MIVFDRSVPVPERRWIRATIRRAAQVFGCESWEFRVRCVRFRSPQLASCAVYWTTSLAEIGLHPKRFGDRALMRTDLLHELWHLHDNELLQTLRDLSSHIPDALQRKRAHTRAYRRYESWHDRTARIIERLL